MQYKWTFYFKKCIEAFKLSSFEPLFISTLYILNVKILYFHILCMIVFKYTNYTLYFMALCENFINSNYYAVKNKIIVKSMKTA